MRVAKPPKKPPKPSPPTDWGWFAIVTIAVIFGGLVVGEALSQAIVRLPWDTRGHVEAP